MQETAVSLPYQDWLTLASTGKWTLLELVEAAQTLADQGRIDNAISLYRQWLISTPSPMAHMAYFNLGVNLSKVQRESEAESAYRQALEIKPDFREARINLSAILSRSGRPEEAQHILHNTRPPEMVSEADQRASEKPSHNKNPPHDTPEPAELLPDNSAKGKAPKGNAHKLLLDSIANRSLQGKHKSNIKNAPLVSILIPTHNRPYYFDIAFRSALAQTYPNIEIVISDNGDDELTQEYITPFLTDKRIKYYREKGMPAYNNWSKCIELASADYVSYLMDDDMLHPEKIERMMKYMVTNPTVGIVTSFRQLIDKDGDFLPPANPTEQLFPKDTLIRGPQFGEFILKNGRNVLGEPTTVLIKKKAIEQGFGWYFGEQFFVLSDVAAWLSILKDEDCIYISDALSYFRIHEGQDQKNSNMKVRATVDWFRLFLLSHRNGVFIEKREDFHEMLAFKLNALIAYITSNHEEMRDKKYNHDELEKLIAEATHELLMA